MHVWPGGGMATGILASAAFWTLVAPAKEERSAEERVATFAFFAFAKGLTLGPALEGVVAARPDVVLRALAASAVCFACFSLAAVFARRRSYLYLGAALGTASLYLILVSMFNSLFGSLLAHEVQVYGWLAVFVGYCIFDTQVCVEDFYNGQRDVARHAAQLYVDVVDLFFKLLELLLRKEDSRKRR